MKGNWLRAHPVNGHDEGAEFVLGQILQFVEQDGDRPVGGLRRLGDGQDQLGQVLFEIAAVGQAGFHVHADIDVANRNLKAGQEALEGAQSAAGLVPGAFDEAELQQDRAQGRDQEIR